MRTYQWHGRNTIAVAGAQSAPRHDERALLTALAILLLAVSGLVARAQADGGAADEPEVPAAAAVRRETRIQADSVDMDFNEHTATFEGNVRVTDGQMQVTSERMVVRLSPENELRMIIATGNVVIVNPEQDRRATAGRAEYNVETGAIELTEAPRLEMGGNRLEKAEKITYFRDSGRVITDGGMITFQPGEGKAESGFLGEEKTE